MKLKKSPSIFIALVMLLCLTLCAGTVFAAPQQETSDTFVSTQHVYTLQSDGSAAVTQTIAAHFAEPRRNVQIVLGALTSTPDDLVIRVDGHTLTDRNAQGYDRKSNLYNYKGSASSAGYSVTCYFPYDSQSVTIECSYTLASVLTVYTDAAIIKAELIDDDAYATQSAQTTLVLPAQADAEQIDVFWDDYHVAPEPKTDGSRVTITLENMPAGQTVRMLVAAPVSLFADVPNNMRLQSEALPELLQTRDRELTYINYREWFGARQGRIIVVSLVAAVFLGYVTRIRRRRHRPLTVTPSKNVLPKELSAAQFALLMGFYRRYGKRRRARNALYGTLISLIDRGILSVYPVEDSVNDCLLVYTPWEGCETSGDENILLLLLFEDIAAGESSVTLSQIKQYARLLPGVVSAALRHMNDYAVSEMAQAHDIEFFRFIKLPIAFLFQAAFLAGAVFMCVVQCWSAAFAMLLSVFILSFFGRDRLHRLSQNGEDLYARGKAFRRYIMLCTTAQDGKKPELSWWSSVMGHAAAIGLAPYLHRTLPTLYPELEQPDFAQEHEGSAPLWGSCAAASLGALSTCLWRLSGTLTATQRIIERSDSEK